MGRAPCCDKANVKKGPWSPEEDSKLKEFIEKHGTGGNWISLPQKAGLKRCGKSCRLRWLNYLRPNIRHDEFSEEEDRIICTLYATIGSRWSIIASQLPGRTDNDIKNYWNTRLKKKLMGIPNYGKLKLYPLLPPPQPPQPELPPLPLPPTVNRHMTTSYLEPTSTSSPIFMNNFSLLQSQESYLSPFQHYPPLKLGGDQENFVSSEGYFGNQVEYVVDEVKPLIGNSGGNGCNSFFFSEENTAQERNMYY
ncbi:hypothetical protein NMG60_11033237 [Bertholletia excelsa]